MVASPAAAPQQNLLQTAASGGASLGPVQLAGLRIHRRQLLLHDPLRVVFPLLLPINQKGEKIHCQPDLGFFSNSFPVTMSSLSAANAEIWFTLNGDVAARGTLAARRYTAPFVISNTVTNRAAAFSPDEQPRDVKTGAFISIGAGVRQPARPAGSPEHWRGMNADHKITRK